MSTTTHDRNIAAEARGVEAGHNAILDTDSDGPFIRVKSDTVHSKSYKVRIFASAPGAPVAMTCDPDGNRRSGHLHKSTADGIAPCMHCTRALRRLEREGLAAFKAPAVTTGLASASRWIATDKAFARTVEPTARPGREAAMATAAAGANDDPFAGF